MHKSALKMHEKAILENQISKNVRAGCSPHPPRNVSSFWPHAPVLWPSKNKQNPYLALRKKHLSSPGIGTWVRCHPHTREFERGDRMTCTMKSMFDLRNALTSMKSLIFLQKKDQDEWNYEIAKVPIIMETLKHVSTSTEVCFLTYSNFIPIFNINSTKSWMMNCFVSWFFVGTSRIFCRYICFNITLSLYGHNTKSFIKYIH